MANNKTGNIIWADTDSKSFPESKILLGIVVHCTDASTAARITLGNNLPARSYPTLFDIEVPASQDYAHLDFSGYPIYFPDGIRIKNLSNATVTLILGATSRRV